MPRASIAIRRRLFLKQQSNMPPTRSQSVHAHQVLWRRPGFWQGARDYDVPIIRSSNRRCCRVPCSIQQQIEPGHPTRGRAAGSWHTRTRGLSMVTHNQVQVTSWPEPRSWFSHCWPEPRSTAGLVSTRTSRLPPSKRPYTVCRCVSDCTPQTARRGRVPRPKAGITQWHFNRSNLWHSMDLSEGLDPALDGTVAHCRVSALLSTTL